MSKISSILRSGISRFQIALAVNIPYPLLKIWYENLHKAEGCDYIDFLKATVNKSWFIVSRETGYRIQGRLEREAGIIAGKYTQTKGRKREQLNSKCLTLNIYKILLIVMGLSGATSDYACLRCKIHKLARLDMSKRKDHYNSQPIARTLSEIQEMYSLPRSQSRYSCVRKPLFNIALHHIILDELHLMLRATDRLLGNLIKEVMERDGKADINNKKGEEKGLYLKKLFKEINNAGITFNVWEKKMQMRRVVACMTGQVCWDQTKRSL